MAARRGVAVGGTHGKTTTTALVAHLLRAAGRDPGWLVGGVPLSLPSAASWGQGEHFVAEACEYDLSFLQLDFEVALINSVAPTTWTASATSAVRAAFERFAARVPAHGALVLGTDVPARACPSRCRPAHGSCAQAVTCGWRTREDEHGFAGASRVRPGAARSACRSWPPQRRPSAGGAARAGRLRSSCGGVWNTRWSSGVGPAAAGPGRERRSACARGLARHVQMWTTSRTTPTRRARRRPGARALAGPARRRRLPAALGQPHRDFLSGFVEALRCFDEALLRYLRRSRPGTAARRRVDRGARRAPVRTRRGWTRARLRRSSDRAAA